MSFDEAVALLSGPKTWCDGAAALKRLGDPRGLLPLLQAYRARAEGSKSCLIEAIAALATPESVAAQYEAGDSRTRAALLVGMYLAPSSSFLPLIEKATADADEDVRGQARRALSNWKNEADWRAVMLRLLDAADVSARRCAIEGLAGLKAPEIVAALRRRLGVEPDADLKALLQRTLDAPR